MAINYFVIGAFHRYMTLDLTESQARGLAKIIESDILQQSWEILPYSEEKEQEFIENRLYHEVFNFNYVWNKTDRQPKTAPQGENIEILIRFYAVRGLKDVEHIVRGTLNQYYLFRFLCNSGIGDWSVEAYNPTITDIR